MQILNQNLMLAIAAASLLATVSPARSADVDINVRLPGAYQVPVPVYVQPRPTYVLTRQVVIQQPVMIERENHDDRDWDCKKDKCKHKRHKEEKNEKHDKHHGHGDDGN